MAKQRVVNTKFWDDSYITSLDRSEKLLFIYLLTNPLTNIAGAYEITPRRIEFDTAISTREIIMIFRKFERANRITYRDGWVVIHNFIKNQSVNPKVAIGIAEAIKHCPKWIKEAYEIGFDSLSHLNSDSDSDLDSDSNLDSDLSDSGDSPKGEVTEPKRPASQRRPVDERKNHPAISCALKASKRYPPKDLWDAIIAALGESPDEDFISSCFTLWRSVNGSPMNFEKWLFEPARTGKPPEIFSNGTSKPTTFRAQRGAEVARENEFFDELRRSNRARAAELSKPGNGDSQRQLHTGGTESGD